MEVLETLDLAAWMGPFRAGAVEALEAGKILYLPKLKFDLSQAELRFLAPSWLSGKAKNISFDPRTQVLRGSASEGADREDLQAMLARFSALANGLMRALCPSYREHLVSGLASFRPAEIAGRTASWRKDDTRLHVDAFPSRPNQGRRILRLFANVNPSASRLWRAGEPFKAAAAKLLPRVPTPIPGSLWMLEHLRITKGRRTLYDHFMLGIHDAMKADSRYQAEVPKTEIAFPAGTVWSCFTDCVSHAAMSGQHAFEQTFSLPVEAMRDPSLSPLRILETQLAKALA